MKESVLNIYNEEYDQVSELMRTLYIEQLQLNLVI